MRHLLNINTLRKLRLAAHRTAHSHFCHAYQFLNYMQVETLHSAAQRWKVASNEQDMPAFKHRAGTSGW